MPISFGDASYENGTISLPITVNAEGVNENVIIYAAEYSEDGALVKLVGQRVSVTQTLCSDISFIKDNEANELRLFIWNDKQIPYCEARRLK